MRRSDFSFANLGVLKICALAATVVFIGTVTPLLGGLPKGYELREFAASVGAFLRGETSSPQTDPALYPHHNDSAPAQAANEEAAPVRPRRIVSASAEDPRETEASLVAAVQTEALEGAVPDGAIAPAGEPATPAPMAPEEPEAAPEAPAVEG